MKKLFILSLLSIFICSCSDDSSNFDSIIVESNVEGKEVLSLGQIALVYDDITGDIALKGQEGNPNLYYYDGKIKAEILNIKLISGTAKFTQAENNRLDAAILETRDFIDIRQKNIPCNGMTDKPCCTMYFNEAITIEVEFKGGVYHYVPYQERLICDYGTLKKQFTLLAK